MTRLTALWTLLWAASARGAADEPDPVHYVGIAGGLDLSLIYGGAVCSPESRIDYYCVDRSGAPYLGQPQPYLDNNNVRTGFRLSTLRASFLYEHLLTPRLGLGVFLGYAFNGGPTPPNGTAFVPWNAELRASFYPAALRVGRISPVVYLDGGIAQVDAGVDVRVVEVPCSSGESYCDRELVAWRRSGLGFVGVGGGASYRWAREHRLSATLRAAVTFSATSFVLSPEVSYAFGF